MESGQDGTGEIRYATRRADMQFDYSIIEERSTALRLRQTRRRTKNERAGQGAIEEPRDNSEATDEELSFEEKRRVGSR